MVPVNAFSFFFFFSSRRRHTRCLSDWSSDVCSSDLIGAADYLAKPFDVEELRMIVAKALATQALEHEVRYLRAQVLKSYAFHNLVGKSPAMQEIYSKIEQVADTRTTVLITGESGTGKELVARALHYNSSRQERPFIALN